LRLGMHRSISKLREKGDLDHRGFRALRALGTRMGWRQLSPLRRASPIDAHTAAEKYADSSIKSAKAMLGSVERSGRHDGNARLSAVRFTFHNRDKVRGEKVHEYSELAREMPARRP
jgi:hypothetical protein